MNLAVQVQSVFPESSIRILVNIKDVQTEFLKTRGSHLAEQEITDPWIAQGLSTDLPNWAQNLVPSLGNNGFESNNGMKMREVMGSHSRLRTIVIREAVELSPEELTQKTHLAYEAILDGLNPAHLARAWNFVPGINDAAGNGLDRYMMFNAGRFAAFSAAMPQRALYPVASGVGHAGNDLVLHMLSGTSEASLIMNSRQRAPHEYSQRYGPVPPAFSRGALVRIGGENLFLVSGTASVLGEKSSHTGDASGQLVETVNNLRQVCKEAQGCASTRVNFNKNTEWLVYTTRMDIADEIRDSLCADLNASAERIQVRFQPLCRSELIVEIECATKLDNDKRS